MSAPDYRLILATPDSDVYCHLRQQAGLSPKTPEAAARGLANSLFAVQVMLQQQVVGMGRVIGDGGCFYQIVDIAVLPAHQGLGLGKRIMHAILDYLQQHAPASAYVSLIADGDAQHLYAQFGFAPTAPASIGMFRRY